MSEGKRVRVGLIVNPVAGMGGSVGLKGTDGQVQRAVRLGALPVTPERTREFVSRIKGKERIDFWVAPDRMGALFVPEAVRVVGKRKKRTSAADTRRIAREMVDGGVELLVFVGGDGTARDVEDAVGRAVPVVAVPGGVKVFSSVFAVNPRAAAAMVDVFLEGAELEEEEVLDIDEQAFRDNRLAAKPYGTLLTPKAPSFRQRGKECSRTDAGATESKRRLAASVAEGMEPDTLYLLGPGTTVKAVAEAAGVEKTLLGVDAVMEGRLVGRDLSEAGILRLLESHEASRIIVTPIGGNGFLFGRGNRQFTPGVLRRVGVENVMVVAAANKLAALEVLHVDTGDCSLDESFCGTIGVIVGDRETVKMQVRG